MKSELNGKWALVTGASRGIGQQIALGLARCGCNIVLHARSQENLAATRELLASCKVELIDAPGELANEEGRKAVIQAVENGPGYIDILYNNAAINCNSTPVFEFDISSWQEVFEVNVFAMIALCNAFCPGMKKRNWGRVVNMSSGIADQPNLAPYSVSKAAVDKWTKDLASEFDGTGVRANYLDPGWIQTDLGGPDAWETVETVLPGVLAPVLIADNGPNGKLFEAQDFKFFE